MEEEKAGEIAEEVVEEIVEKVIEDAEDDLDEGALAEGIAELMEEERNEGVSDSDVQETLDKAGDKEEELVAEEAEAESDPERADNFLVPRQKYLASGIHIGMKQRTKQMRQFIYKIRPDGLAVMNLQIIDQRIRIAAKFLSKAKNMVVVSRRGIAHRAIEKFAEVIGTKAVTKRFMPGTLTNPNYGGFYEADMVFVVDPTSDYQAVREAVNARIPIVAVADTFNETNNIDLVIPANNKGAKSIATLFWLLAREILREQGKLKSDDDYPHKVEDFMKELERRERDFDDGDRRRRRDDGRGGRSGRGFGRGRGQSRGRERDSRTRSTRR